MFLRACPDGEGMNGVPAVTSAQEREPFTAELRSRLVRRAASVAEPLARQDAEDLAHSAALKALLEKPRPHAPPLDVRVMKHLHDVSVDSSRRRFTRSERDAAGDPAVQLAAIPFAADEHEVNRRVLAALRDELDVEEFEFVLLKACGFTDAEIPDEIPTWDHLRVTRVRRRLTRKRSTVIKLILES
jgi:hypothetical protein